MTELFPPGAFSTCGRIGAKRRHFRQPEFGILPRLRKLLPAGVPPRSAALRPCATWRISRSSARARHKYTKGCPRLPIHAMELKRHRQRNFGAPRCSSAPLRGTDAQPHADRLIAPEHVGKDCATSILPNVLLALVDDVGAANQRSPIAPMRLPCFPMRELESSANRLLALVQINPAYPTRRSFSAAPPHAHSPLRKTGMRLPSALTPSMSV